MKRGHVRESELHVVGATPYLDDRPEPRGLLYAAIVVSKTAHGRLAGIDAAAALALHPSVRMIVASDIPGENRVGEDAADEPLLAADMWDHAGQPIALILAGQRSLARRAAALVVVHGEEVPALTDARVAATDAGRATARCPDPRSARFIRPPRTMRTGDPTSAFARCTVVVVGRVESGGQEHVYLETQGAIAEPRGGQRMHVCSGTQSPSGVQHAVARVLALSMADVEVETSPLGGGFGGKETQATHWAVLAALGAAVSRRPVKVHLSRREDMRWTGKRHPYSTDFRIGLDGRGMILAFEADYYQNSGACCDLSPAILSRTLFHAAGAYRVPNVRVTGYMCRTNLPPFTAFRGFGAPQAVFVMECALDAAAAEGGWDPAEIRRRNLLLDGDRFHYGQRVSACRAALSVDRLLEKVRWAELRSEIRSFNSSHRLMKRGAAILPICFGVSFTKLQMNQGGALVHVFHDGSVSVATGAVEMGQQVARKIQVVVARALGAPESRVTIQPTRTSTVANTLPTAASTGADINGMAAIAASRKIHRRLLACAARRLGVEPGGLEIEDGQVRRGSLAAGCSWDELVAAAYAERVDLTAHGFRATPDLFYDPESEQGSPFAYHVYGCAAVSATVDVLRGTYRVDRATIVHDAGESIDPLVDLGQVEGGFAQGLGWSLLEDLRYGEDGQLLSDSLSTYKLPTVHFIPVTEVELLAAAGGPRGLMGSKAIGEPPFLYGIAGYFAVLDALRAARGAGPGLYDLPMTPEKALDYVQGVRP